MSFSSYDKIQSIDWNGQYFILTSRSEITDGSFSYAYSADGTTWETIQFGSDISGANPYITKWLGDKFIVAGNIVSSSSNGFGSTTSQTCLVNVVEGAYPTKIQTNLATDTVIYDIEKNIELPHRIVFPRTVVLALGATISISLDQGNSWTPVSTDLSYCYDAVWNGHHWVAVGEGTRGTIITSLDGIRWVNRGNYVFSTSCNGIDWSPQQNKYVAIGESVGGTCVFGTSSDGIYWRGRNTNLFSVGNDVKWNGSIWISVGQASVSGQGNTIAYSVDGESWTYAAASFGTSGLRVYWDGAIWTAFGSDPSYNIATSVDGVHWNLFYNPLASALSLGFSEPDLSDASLNIYVDIPFALRSPATRVEKYVHNHSDKGTVIMQPISVACGYGQTTLAYSVDGIKWYSANNALFTRCNKASWNGQLWVAVGTGAYCIATSLDGVSWIGTNSSIMTEAYDIAWNGQTWIAVGEGSTRIASSADGLVWTSVSESVFSTRVQAIEWTGSVWLAYGYSGSAVSADGQTWTAKNLCITDCSNLTLVGATYTASSSQPTYSASNANDGLSATFWSSNTSLYDTSGNYVGSESTSYDSSQTAAGEWIQIQLTGNAVCQNYFLMGSNLASFLLLGSADGSTWILLDSVLSLTQYNSGGILPLAISNTTAYSYYRLVATSTTGSDSASIGEIALFDGGSGNINTYIRPIVLKDRVLHPTRVFSIDGSTNNVYRVSDLSGNLMRDSSVMAGSETTASTFDGEYHVVFGKNGEVGYLSNSASLTNLVFDNSLNGVSLNTGLSDIRAACYNRKYILIGGASGAAYGIFKHNAPPAFYNTNLSSLMTTILGISSNSGYGSTVCNNTIHLKENERLSMTTPKFQTSGCSYASVSFNVYKS